MDKRIIFRNILMQDQLERVADSCAKHSIEICLLKGISLITQAPVIAVQRDMEDIDILIKEADFNAFSTVMSEMGYQKVLSGETGFYKEGENAVIDVHTAIDYMDQKQLYIQWKEMINIGDFKVLTLEEEFIYIMHHGIVHHANMSVKWVSDLNILMGKVVDLKILSDKIKRYNLSEIYFIATEYLKLPALDLKINNLKKAYAKFIIKLPAHQDKGHFLKPLTSPGTFGMLTYIYKFIFPDIVFLKRRYALRPAVLMLLLRPFLLLYKGVAAGYTFCSKP